MMLNQVVLGKHKYYCEMCKKQCRDENAFRQHKHSSFHQQRMMEFHSNPEVFIERYSNDFLTQFNEIFRIKFGYSAFIPATKAYNEYIKDPHHTHLNSTKWASLSDFIYFLQNETDLYEVVKEQTAGAQPVAIGASNGGDKSHEKLMVRMIDKTEGVSKGSTDKERRENARELEKRREEKDLEKMIKKANKLQNELEKRKLLSVKDQDGKEIDLNQDKQFQQQNGISGFSFTDSSNNNQYNEQEDKAIETAHVGVKRCNFMRDSDIIDDKEEFILLQKQTKQKSSVLDKFIKHQSTNHQQYQNSKIELKSNFDNTSIEQQKIQQERPQWVRKHLIVKIKKPHYQYNNLKAIVSKSEDAEKIQLIVQNDSKTEIMLNERDLTKVLPSEGGRVMILTDGTVGEIREIDMKYKDLIVRVDDSKGESRKVRVKFDDVCKINQ